MKKNRTMRAASLLLVLTLITSTFVGGTFAKYVTTGEAKDTARVAKWGVTIEATKDGTAFSKEYKETGKSNGEVAVLSSTEEYVVAPGTSSDEVNGNLIFSIKGTPEVRTQIKIEFNPDATDDQGDKITYSDIHYAEYYPIVFTLSVRDTNKALEDTDSWTEAVSGTLAQIENFLESEYSTDGVFYSEPNVPLDAEYKLTWKWAYEGQQTLNGKTLTAEQVDQYDTILGNLAAGVTTNAGNADYSTTLKYGVKITATQVD